MYFKQYMNWSKLFNVRKVSYACVCNTQAGWTPPLSRVSQTHFFINMWPTLILNVFEIIVRRFGQSPNTEILVKPNLDEINKKPNDGNSSKNAKMYFLLRKRH